MGSSQSNVFLSIYEELETAVITSTKDDNVWKISSILEKFISQFPTFLPIDLMVNMKMARENYVKSSYIYYILDGAIIGKSGQILSQNDDVNVFSYLIEDIHKILITIEDLIIEAKSPMFKIMYKTLEKAWRIIDLKVNYQYEIISYMQFYEIYENDLDLIMDNLKIHKQCIDLHLIELFKCARKSLPEEKDWDVDMLVVEAEKTCAQFAIEYMPELFSIAGKIQKSHDDFISFLENLEENTHISKNCSVCLANPKEFLIVPCGHFCMCFQCNKKVNKTCPICRTPIKFSTKVIDS